MTINFVITKSLWFFMLHHINSKQPSSTNEFFLHLHTVVVWPFRRVTLGWLYTQPRGQWSLFLPPSTTCSFPHKTECSSPEGCTVIFNQLIGWLSKLDTVAKIGSNLQATSLNPGKAKMEFSIINKINHKTCHLQHLRTANVWYEGISKNTSYCKLLRVFSFTQNNVFFIHRSKEY